MIDAAERRLATCSVSSDDSQHACKTEQEHSITQTVHIQDVDRPGRR